MCGRRKDKRRKTRADKNVYPTILIWLGYYNAAPVGGLLVRFVASTGALPTPIILVRTREIIRPPATKLPPGDHIHEHRSHQSYPLGDRSAPDRRGGGDRGDETICAAVACAGGGRGFAFISRFGARQRAARAGGRFQSFRAPEAGRGG